MMIKRVTVCLVSHFLLCTSLFLCIQKPIFLLYNLLKSGKSCPLEELAEIYRHGVALDAATAAYLSAIPLLVLCAHLVFPAYNPRKTLLAYDGFVALLLSLVTMADACLYEFWEFKLDATVFFYLDDPKNAFASVSSAYLLVRALAILLLAAVYYLILSIPVSKTSWEPAGNRKRAALAMPVFLVLAGGALFATMRGLRIWPNTPGRAYYSKTAFYNHAALNPLFNIAYTSGKQEDFSRQFQTLPDEECERICDALFPTSGTAEPVLRTTRPDILVIVLEGFGACFIEELGGMKEVAPNLSRLCKEGVNFAHCYCSSFRTDRGIVSALSGYPGQPTTSIMRYSHKLRSLPGLPKSLKKAGYQTQVLYAGDMTFFNMADYFISAGHDRLVSQDEFPAEQRTAKWGVPDHVAFEWLFQDIQKKHKENDAPWYTTFLTISSHVPFDVPYHRLKDEKLNAFAYTDSCMGDFIDRLQATPAWDNLLVVCTADHGFNHWDITSPDFPHIPFLLLGGAVKQACRKEQIVCQTDLPATILGQLRLPHEDFSFSRDVLADTYTAPSAFSTFNNGFNFRDSTGCTVYDNTASRALHGADPEREKKGKAILQKLYKDLSER